jgi:hypothetical protein
MTETDGGAIFTDRYLTGNDQPYNPFRLLNREHPDFAQATAALKAICVKAVNEILEVQEQLCREFGATDSETREATIEYVSNLFWHPPKQVAENIELWRLVVIDGKGLARKEVKHRGLNFINANSRLDEMHDVELITHLKVDSEKLPWILEQIADIRAKFEAGKGFTYRRNLLSGRNDQLE